MEYQPRKCLLERDVGITNFIGDNKGFVGTLKHRYSDFHVNEVSSSGEIVKLTDESVPEECLESEEVDYKIDAVPPEILLQLVELTMHGGEAVTIDVTDKSKDERREIHDLIRKKFPSKLVSNTKEQDGKKVLIVSKSNKSDCERRPAWPARRKGDYVHFVMYKENKDTMEVVNLIARKLKMKPNFITYAGTKDRRAKTSQMLCVRRVEPSNLASINKYLNGVSLGNYTFKTTALSLGELKGNNFRIAIRNVTGLDDDIECAMNSLKSDGFINYYGLQRFGSVYEVPTHQIGKALLLGDWTKAVDLILSPRETETRTDVKAARKTWQETRNAEAACRELGKGQNTVEGKLLQGLVKNGSNMMAALNYIPRNMRLLYLHSYQSLMWNRIASRRIKELGLKPIVGDLILKKLDDFSLQDVAFKPKGAVKLETASDGTSDESLVSGGVDERETLCCEEEEYAVMNRIGSRNCVSVLSDETVGEATIEDVVLPLPGHDVTYPSNSMSEWYKELLRADGLTSETMKQKCKSYSVAGAYRHLVKRPENLSWRTVRYAHPEDTLILSDLEQLRLVQEPADNPDGKHKALIVEFTLPPSSYATMALRQAMRQDTSPGVQASLSHGDKRACEGEQPCPKKTKAEDPL